MKTRTCITVLSLSIVAWVAIVIVVAQTIQTANVEGRISDPFGFPISGAKVELLSEDRPEQFRALADKLGRYAIINLPAGRYKALISSLGFATEERSIRVWEGEELILDVGLSTGGADLPAIKVSGTVRQLDKRPLEDATITVANAFNQRLVQKARTDKQGRYAVSVYNPGQYIVSASKAGFMVSVAVKVLPATLPRKRFNAHFTLRQL